MTAASKVNCRSWVIILSCSVQWCMKLSSSWAVLAMAFQFVLIGMLVCSVWSFVVSTSANDVVALQGLLREWQGTPGGALLDNWSLNEDADPCRARWKGVVCSSSQSVVNLRLNDAGLSGGIPTAIGGLEKLEILDLSGNTWLTSTIPKEIGLLRRLTHLNLSGCNLTGEVPQEIYNLNNLKSIDFCNNPHLSVKLDARLRISLNQAEPESTTSRPHFLHHRSLLQSSKSNNGNRRNLPIFYTYIAVGCVGVVFLIIITFCCCRYLSVRKTRDDIFLTTPGAPGHLTTFQSKPSRSIHIANRNLDMEVDRH